MAPGRWPPVTVDAGSVSGEMPQTRPNCSARHNEIDRRKSMESAALTACGNGLGERRRSLPFLNPVADSARAMTLNDFKTGFQKDSSLKDLRQTMNRKFEQRPMARQLSEADLSPVKLSAKERHALSAKAADLQTTVPSLPPWPTTPLRAPMSTVSLLDFAHDLFLETEVKDKPEERKPSRKKREPSKQRSDERKPTESMRQVSRSRHNTVRKPTVKMEMRGANHGNLPAPSEQSFGTLMPSVKEALERYYAVDTLFSETELKRMRCIFYRFAVDGEVVRDILHETVIQLGYLSTDEDEVNEIAKQTTDFSTLDFLDFLSFCERFVMHEREQLQVKIDEFLERDQLDDGAFVDPVASVQAFLDGFGMCSTKDSVQKILELGGLEGRACDTVEELLRFLAARRALEGFTHTDLEKAKEAFDSCESPSYSDPRQGFDGKVIKAQELLNGLLSFAGLYASDHIRELQDKIEEGLDQQWPSPVSFYEFLTWCRRLREVMIEEISTQFKRFDEDEDDFIETVELRELCASLGFTLADAEWEAFTESQRIADDAWLDVQTVWYFVQDVRDQNGFTKTKQEELMNLFTQFCDESGDMPNAKAMELFQYMGYDGSPEEIMQLTKRVDYNENGTMDGSEFLCLMRFQRESSMADYKSAFQEGKLDKGMASFDAIFKAIQASKLKLTPSLLRQVLDECAEEQMYNEDAQNLSFNGFLYVAETLSKKYTIELRKRANFKDDDLDLMKSIFNLHDGSTGYLSRADFLWLLQDSDLAVNDKIGRTQIFEALDRGRTAALAAGVESERVGNPASPRVRFVPLAHFVRGILQEHEHEVFQKEDKAMAAVTFSEQEIKEFRQLFRTLAVQAGTSSYEEVMAQKAQAKPKRRSSTPAANDHKVKDYSSVPVTLGALLKKLKYQIRIPVQIVMGHVASMGIRISSQQRLALSSFMMKHAEPETGLDFAGFLEVMQWIVDNNFGNIKGSFLGIAHVLDCVDIRQRSEPRRVSA